MTCIVGLVEQGVVYLGADSLGCAEWNSRVLAMETPKVFRRGPFLFGVTGSLRWGQLLQYKLVIPGQDETPDMAYMVGTVLDAIRQCLKENGFAQIENSQETGGVCLIGYKGKLYSVDDDYGVLVTVDDFAALGCGDMPALGALMALTGMEPRERLMRALEISAYFSAGVGGPFHIISSEGGAGAGLGEGARPAGGEVSG